MLSTLVELIQVIFNNNHGDQAQRNGKTLQGLLEGGDS